MAITIPQGTYTGLLGYNREYEYLGDSNLPFRIVEEHTYEVFDSQLDSTEDLASYFKTRFAEQLNYYSGDVDVISLDYPQSEAFDEDGMRLQKYNITLRSRASGSFSPNSADGYDNTKNAGLSGVVVGYMDILKGFSESFSFNLSEEGNQNYSHSLNFSLQTGENTTGTAGLRIAAKEIALAVFDTADGTDLSNVSFTGYTNYTDSNSKQYISETFDDLAHTYSFQKDREIFAHDSGNYTHSMNHALSYGDDGYFQITESLSVLGKKEYQQALDGFNNLVAGSSGRCAEKINHYAPIVERQTNDSSVTASSGIKQIRLSKVFKIPNLMVDGSVVFTNDPSYFDNITKSDELSVERESNGTIKMNHSFNYGLLDFVDGETDTKVVSGSSNIVQLIAGDRTDSVSSCQSTYESLTGITGRRHVDALTLIETSVNAPVRGKQYSATFSFSDNPIYNLSRIVNPFTQSAVTGFKTMEVSLDEIAPKDIIEEYKIINRGSKQSVLSYGYQQEPGSVSVSCKGQLIRPAQNLFEQFKYPSGEALGLLKYSKGLFLDHVMANEKLYNYYLRGSSYSFGSDNTLDLNLDFVYTRKR